MALDSKYGKLVAERGRFHDDEPVFVLRAKDLLAPHAVEVYAALARAASVGIEPKWDTRDLLEIADQADNVAAAMRVWQGINHHLVKLPD